MVIHLSSQMLDYQTYLVHQKFNLFSVTYYIKQIRNHSKKLLPVPHGEWFFLKVIKYNKGSLNKVCHNATLAQLYVMVRRFVNP